MHQQVNWWEFLLEQKQKIQRHKGKGEYFHMKLKLLLELNFHSTWRKTPVYTGTYSDTSVQPTFSPPMDSNTFSSCTLSCWMLFISIQAWDNKIFMNAGTQNNLIIKQSDNHNHHEHNNTTHTLGCRWLAYFLLFFYSKRIILREKKFSQVHEDWHSGYALFQSVKTPHPSSIWTAFEQHAVSVLTNYTDICISSDA